MAFNECVYSEKQKTYGYDFNLNVRKLFKKDNNIFDYLSEFNTIYLDSGRSCIHQLCQLIAGKEILVPAFSCHAVIHSFTHSVKPVFYEINDDFTINIEDLENRITKSTAAVYLSNYYGHLQPKAVIDKLKNLRNQYGFLIFEDNTQSLFSTGILAGDYCLASTRKWWAVPDGAALYSNNKLDDILWDGLKQDSKQMDKLCPQILKSMLLNGKIAISAERVNELFAEVEEELNEYTSFGEAFLMSDFTEFIYKCNAWPETVTARKENEHYLRSLIDNPYIRFTFNEFEANECPFQLPMYCETRDELWNYLADKFKIFASVLWRTNMYPEVNEIGCTARMGREIISLPVDQRYRKKDMEFLAEALNSYHP